MGTYCDPEDVQGYLQTDTAWSTTTNPTRADVERLIEAVESEIDDRTAHSWRPRRVAEEYHTAKFSTVWRIGRPAPYVELEHWLIKALSNSAGDRLEVWDGSNYIDWLDPAEGKTHGRISDFFLQARKGYIFFPIGFPVAFRFNDGVRVTYRYGDVDVLGTVHQLAVMMTAEHIVRSDHRILVAAGGPQGPETTSQADVARQLRKEIDKTFADTSWIRSPRNRFRISGGPHGR